MSIINPLVREMSAKIVYYGPGLSGKTTTLKYVYSAVRPERRGELVTLATEGDRTLFFDFLPVQLDRVQGMPLRLQLYTVPGQVFYAATRKLVLDGADGVVFVSDSQRDARDSNQQSLEDLVENLRRDGLDIANVPLVFQHNKRDIDDVLELEQLDELLNHWHAPSFGTCATNGTGVLSALREVTRLVASDLHERHRVAQKKSMPELTVVDGDASISTRLSQLAEQTSPPAAPKPAPGESWSFGALWGDLGAEVVHDVERGLRKREWAAAARAAAVGLADLLRWLPGASGADGPMAKAALLGLDGREYLRLARLASAPDATVTEADALFALYLLVAARVKATS